jgi:transcriptional regulator with GAF, ATPase, and Fis domain
MSEPDDERTLEGTIPAGLPVADATLTPSAKFALVVTDGPQAGLSIEIDGSGAGPNLIGQGDACDLRLTDARASRRHAAIDLEGRALRVTDLGSTNGTFVNGSQVIEGVLRGGEVVRIGQTTIRVDLLVPATMVAVSPAARFGRLVGASAPMRRLYPLLERLAASEVSVVIEGETGTGKELLAESLHERGRRASRPFVVLDCTAVAPSLVESELFGHERGAFTGAVSTRKGVFEQAHGGTLLIDEIGDLPAALQPKLLRALERSEVRPVGGTRTIRVDVRVLSATHRNLDAEVQAGRFRDDLFHRLAVARVELPPLRRRKGDIAMLARAFWHHMDASSPALPESLLRAWEDYGWPGNVRELRNAVARRLALGELASTGDASQRPRPPSAAEPSAPRGGALEEIVAMGLSFPAARQRVIEELERRYIEKVLAEHDGNVSRAAEASGIARRQFQRVKVRIGQ